MSTDPSVANLLGMARTAALAGNQEEALGYFNRVLESDPAVSEAWLGKGTAAGWQSTLVNIRLSEALVAYSHAIATAPEDAKEHITSEVVGEVNKIAVALYGMARRHLDEYIALPDSWSQYVVQVSQTLASLEQVLEWSPHDRTTLENIVHLCRDNIEGVSYRDPYDNNTSKAWHLTPEYEALLKSKMDSASAILRRLDPSYVAPQVEKKQADSCFVVTATMGRHDHPTVLLLRRFREEYLLRRWWGCQLVQFYYQYGPRVARLITRSLLLRALSNALIVSPSAWIARRLIR